MKTLINAALCAATLLLTGGSVAFAATFKVTASGTLPAYDFGTDSLAASGYDLHLTFSADDSTVGSPPLLIPTNLSGTLSTDAFGDYAIASSFSGFSYSNSIFTVFLSSDDFNSDALGNISAGSIRINLPALSDANGKTTAGVLDLSTGVEFVQFTQLVNPFGTTLTRALAPDSTSITRLPEPSAVPLPAAGWALLTALGGLAALRRRRRHIA